MKTERWTVGLSLFFILAGALTLFVWIPNDIETGIVETFRRRTTIGDAMAPTLVATGVLVCSAIMGILSILKVGEVDDRPAEPGPDRRSYKFLLHLAIVIGLGLVVMVYAGPLAVELLNVFFGETGTYRQLKASFPYKYVGYLLGSVIIVTGIIQVVENRFSKSAVWVSVLAVLGLIILYDMPFDNLLLPPNGDF